MRRWVLGSAAILCVPFLITFSPMLWSGGKGKGQWRLLARRAPFSMQMLPAEQVSAMLPEMKITLGDESITFATGGTGTYHARSGGRRHGQSSGSAISSSLPPSASAPHVAN